jgi:uncharacterized protein (DUF1800 family)
MPDRFPYAQAGLSAEEAAAHLVGRFTFGAAPGQVERVAETGLERWFEAQLRADAPEPEWERMASDVPGLGVPLDAIAQRTLSAKQLRERAFEAGAVAQAKPTGLAFLQRRAWRDRIEQFRTREGLFTPRDLFAAAQQTRIARAVVAHNQLLEVMAAFWANHVYVGRKVLSDRFLGDYDEQVIRPHALGRFSALIGASARHPAMLLYLDNAQSSAPKGAPTAAPLLRRVGGRSKGLNENYARELMELHTLGVDGPYTQADVEAVARVFTGWSTVPAGMIAQGPTAWRAMLGEKAGPHRDRFVLDGLFLFRADLHDATEKTVLGERMPAGGGIEEGERVLTRLAAHPSTARHVATHLARRFVSDSPSDAVVSALADAFTASSGGTRETLRALVASPAFWSEEAVRQKVKTPFELVVGAVRGTGAGIEFQNGLLRQMATLGEAPFGHLAPDGYPDHAAAWINAGTLLNRMRFGVDLAAGDVPGVDLDADRFVANAGYDPHDPSDALDACLEVLLAGRDLEPARELLRPVLLQPAYAARVAEASPPPASRADEEGEAAPRRRRRAASASPTPAQQALSVVLGSPEFQRQ